MPAFAFLLGLIVGSFANVVALRLNTGESLIFGGSRCFLCQKRLRWFELIPLVSYFALRGRCRSCGSAISFQYPLVELASGFLFLSLYLSKVEPWLWIKVDGQGSTLETIALTFSFAFFWLLLVLSVYDIRHQILPDSLVFAAGFAAFLYVLLTFGAVGIAWNALAGGLLFLFFGGLWFLSRGRWMGFGDAKLAFAIGLFLGWPLSIVAFFFSFWLGAIVGVAWVARQRARSLRIPIPFGPFLAAGALVAHLWGAQLIGWYLKILYW